jgi:hypothetical protein
MIEDIQKMMDGYLAWLRDKTSLREVGDWVEITTPSLDRHNDHLQIYAKRQNGHFILSDDGYTLQDLEQSGCKLDSPKRQELLRLTLNGFGVQRRDDALEIKATEENFPLKKHSLLQAMLGVNDLFYLAAPHVSSLFYEDVVAWMNENDIRFVENAKFTGKTGYDHLFEFVIPRSRKNPERILSAVNRPDKGSAMEMVFAWLDTRETRPQESKAYALLNDTERPVRSDVMDAFRSYDVVPIPWSARESVKTELSD